MSLRDTITGLPARVAGFFTNGGRAVAEMITGQSSKPLWPPVSEQPRRLRYQRNELAYAGRHREIFVRYAINERGENIPVEPVTVKGEEFHFAANPQRPYLVYNLCSRVSELLAERAFAEGVGVKLPDSAVRAAAAIAKVTAQNNLQALHLLACTQVSWRGDALYEVYYDASLRKLGVTLADPSYCFPETHPLDATRVMAWNIDQKLTAGKNAPFLWRKRHELRGEDGWIVNKLYRMTEDAQGLHVDFTTDEVDLATHPVTALLADQAEKPTGVKGLLVVHVPNRPTPLSLWGQSDYSADLLGLQGEINDRVSQRAEVLRKFVHPKMAGPLVTDENGAINTNLNYFVTEAGAQPPVVITWDAQLGVVSEAIKDAKAAFATTAGVDISSLTPREIGGPTSGRALRIEQMNTQGAAQQKQRQFETQLKTLYATILQLAAQPYVEVRGLDGKPEDVDPEDIGITFGDGLPSMSIEDAEEQALLLENGLTERAAALKLLHGLSEEEAEQMAARIEGKQGGLPAVPQVAFGSGIRRIGAQAGAE